MGDVVFVEEFAVLAGFEPELAEGFALGVRADDAVEADEAGEADAVEAFGVEDCGCVAHAFGHVCGDKWLAGLQRMRIGAWVLLTRCKVESSDCRLGR